MAQTYTLHSTKENKNTYKTLIAAKYAGASVELVSNFEFGKSNKTPEFLKMNPNGKVPVLETPQGAVWESNAIARYVARLSDNGLFGETPIEAAQVEQWIDFSTISIDAPVQSWVYPLLMPQAFPYDKKKEAGAIAALKTALSVLDKHLSANTYLVGHHVTLADVITWSNLVIPFKQVMDAPFRSAFPAVERWFVTLANQPNFSAVVGDVKLCETPRKFTPPAKEAQKPKEANKSVSFSKEAPAVGEAASEKAAPKTPPMDDTPKPAAKPKDPLMELPPSKMVMDSWKRLYSNTPAAQFNEICLKGLWNGADIPNSPTNEHFEGYDPEGYSLWFLDYKYPEENTVNFIVMNKVGGFLQRIDYVRKHAFAAMCILKDDKEGTFPIRGLFLFRGQDIPPIMKEECYDIDLYNWTKVDVNDPAQKKRVEAILAEEETIDGLENVEVKVFK
jgi:elongation factor 1-gamma